MNQTTSAYIAGFLDGDGSIFFQIVRRKDYKYGYQIRSSIAFYQKRNNAKILQWLKKKLNCGYIRHRKTGISDYTIVKPDDVRRILIMVQPYVILKTEHVKIGLMIIKRLNQVADVDYFYHLCQLVDRFRHLNYSKKRTISSEHVRKFLKRN